MNTNWLPHDHHLHPEPQAALGHLSGHVQLLHSLLRRQFPDVPYTVQENALVCHGMLSVHARTPYRLLSYAHSIDGWELVSIPLEDIGQPEPDEHQTGPLTLRRCGTLYQQAALREPATGPSYLLSQLIVHYDRNRHQHWWSRLWRPQAQPGVPTSDPPALPGVPLQMTPDLSPTEAAREEARCWQQHRASLP